MKNYIIIVVLLVLVLSGYILTNVLPLKLAHTMLYPIRQPLVKNPGDYGLEYEDVMIRTEDGVNLACWLMRGTGRGVIIMGHPGTFSKYGYTTEAEKLFKSGYDRDVEFLITAKHLVKAGYAVLMYDQRNHGQSDASPNEGPHNPFESYKDVLAVVDYVSTEPELKDENIGFLSFCQSAFINMVAMSKQPGALKGAGLKAAVMVQPISLDVFFKEVGLPEWIVETINKIYDEEGMNLKAQDPVKYAKDIFVPVLFMQAKEDPWSRKTHSAVIFDAIPTIKKAIWLEGDQHRFDAYNWFNEDPSELLAFFQIYLRNK